MAELADIFRCHGPEYLARYGDRIPNSHKQAIWDIIYCRTESMGGHIYRCETCSRIHFSFHSCGNRHCPKCLNDRTEIWLEKQRGKLLPMTFYHLITFTLPKELRAVTRSNKKQVYGIFFRTSSAALIKLAMDPRFAGGLAGMAGFLHSWTRDLIYHPHIHYVVPGGGYDKENDRWIPSSNRFFVPVMALSKIFRAKFRDELKKTALYDSVPDEAWKKDWVVHSKPVGDGEAVLKYLAPYVYRVAISNNRIRAFENGKVTFSYKKSDTGKLCKKTLPALEFIRRFLQHVLPKRFIKIRYYGFLAPAYRKKFLNIQYRLAAILTLLLNPLIQRNEIYHANKGDVSKQPLKCPDCGGDMELIAVFRYRKYRPLKPP